jgi:hypothetical protein
MLGVNTPAADFADRVTLGVGKLVQSNKRTTLPAVRQRDLGRQSDCM